MATAILVAGAVSYGLATGSRGDGSSGSLTAGLISVSGCSGLAAGLGMVEQARGALLIQRTPGGEPVRVTASASTAVRRQVPGTVRDIADGERVFVRGIYARGEVAAHSISIGATPKLPTPFRRLRPGRERPWITFGTVRDAGPCPPARPLAWPLLQWRALRRLPRSRPQAQQAPVPGSRRTHGAWSWTTSRVSLLPFGQTRGAPNSVYEDDPADTFRYRGGLPKGAWFTVESYGAFQGPPPNPHRQSGTLVGATCMPSTISATIGPGPPVNSDLQFIQVVYYQIGTSPGDHLVGTDRANPFSGEGGGLTSIKGNQSVSFSDFVRTAPGGRN